MQALSGITFVFALLVALAGSGKLARPDGTRSALRLSGLPDHSVLVRMLGAAEIAVGLAVVLGGGHVPAALLALAYLGFTVFALRQRVAGADCGCFGATSTPVTWVHVGVNAAGATVAAVAAARGAPSLLALLGDQPLRGIPAVGALVVTVILLRLSLTALPDLGTAVSLDHPGANA